MVKSYDSTYLKKLRSFFWKSKMISMNELEISPNRKILDLGCGNGEDLKYLAEHYNAKFFGVDHDSSLIKEAISNCVGLKIEFHRSEASKLPFDNDHFDIIRIERLLQHATDYGSILRETYRVLKPNGILQIIDTDYSTINLNLNIKNLERKLIDVLMYKRIKNGLIISKLNEGIEKVGFQLIDEKRIKFTSSDSIFNNYIFNFDRIVKEEFENKYFSKFELELWNENKNKTELEIDQVILKYVKTFQ